MKQVLIAAIIFLGVASLSEASPFTNGSFESPAGTTTVFLPNGSTYVTGWTHGGNDGGEFYTKTGDWGITAGAGTYYIGWGASSAINGTLFQTFDTIVGATYTVNYLLTTQQLAGVPLPIESNLVEALNGASVLSFVTNSFNQAAGIWNAGATLSFVAVSTSSTLRFTDTTTVANSGPINWGLDNVTVTTTAAGVPEPSTYALIGLGFAVLAVARKKLSR